MKPIDIILEQKNWNGIEIKSNIPHGDMPGDKVQIEEVHIKKAEAVFKELLQKLPSYFEKNKKVVLAVCGGSGVGKSEIASILTYYFENIGIGSYTLSGDNYPHRIPQYNDAERLRIYREGGVKGLALENLLTNYTVEILKQLQRENQDANIENTKIYDWLFTYQQAGEKSLAQYLGTEYEIGFSELTQIIHQFKESKEQIYLRRMGRSESELWYDKIDLSEKNILIIEWTHGNSDYLEGVDFPILLNSTPEETLEHRRSRNRDGSVDSPFIQVVLRLEQDKLKNQAHKAKIILSKNGELLPYEKYCEIMQ